MQHIRFLRFTAVGAGVMLFGAGIMFLLIDVLGWNKHLAYLIQTVITVESNFFLNAALTWPCSGRGQLWRSWLKFHGLKISTIIASQLLFAALLMTVHWARFPGSAMLQRFDYIIAYLGCAAVIMMINFLGNDRWVFRSGR
ncbi:MAG: GtrA family protein [Desulfobacterales bacterium]